jgi:transcriptional antiterminator RfaH
MNWYVIRTKPGQEKQVESQLRQCGIETLLPFLEQTRVIRRHRKTILAPLFPGYLFSRFDLKEHYRTASYARGSIGIVTFGSVPARVDEEMVDSIRSRLTNGVLTIKSKCLLPGQIVRIKSGPMDGLDAVFLYEMTGRQRAVVLLRSLAYQGRLVLPMEQIANG